MTRLFSGDRIGREAIANTRRIAEACNLELEMGKPIFPKFFALKDIPPELAGETPRAALRKLARRGLQERYHSASPPVKREAMARLNYELDVIDRLNFSEYFLIVWDIVNFARRKNIPIMGRGSAANSLVAYSLGMTSPDPLAHNLYFERFLNLSRSDCPDIDLDMCWRRRDEVLQYVYKRHGADCVAMVSNHNTYQARSAFRDVARVTGLPMDEINRLSAALPHYSAATIREAAELFPEARDLPLDREPYRTIVAQAEAIDGFPRHLSIHVGGIVIGDRPLTHYLPLERATKGLIITQYEMNAVEAIGLVKIDLLGHRSLTVIADTVKAVERNWNVRIELPKIPDGDEKTAAVLRGGRTIGCFQIESPGMRSLLQMIRAESRLDVIHALSLIRPGPSGSGMKERFVRRRLGEEETSYLDPRLAEVLGDTYGVMLFQEDILKVAAVIAGFTLEEGDELRQAISKKRSPERIATLQERFIGGALARGVRRTAAEEIWELIGNFAGYSYCKAHAVTYGYISYQASYLKAHYPAEFLCAVLANQGGFYEAREYLEEARRWGVRILPPDVNSSDARHRTEASIGNGQSACAKVYPPEAAPQATRATADRLPMANYQRTINDKTNCAPAAGIRIGLGQVKGLSQRALRSIFCAREKAKFSCLEDFYFRTQVNDSETEKLILCGALDGFGKTRPQLLWELRLLSQEVCKSFGDAPGEGLFGPAEEAGLMGARQPTPSRSEAGLRRPSASPLHSIPPLPEYSIGERIRLEQEILDLAITGHPLRMFSRELAERGLATSDQLPRNVGRSVTVAGWLVAMRRAVTRKQEYMKFLTLEDQFGTMEVILFPDTYRRFGHLLCSYGPYLVRGRIEQNHRSIGITAEWLDTLSPPFQKSV